MSKKSEGSHHERPSVVKRASATGVQKVKNKLVENRGMGEHTLGGTTDIRNICGREGWQLKSDLKGELASGSDREGASLARINPVRKLVSLARSWR